MFKEITPLLKQCKSIKFDMTPQDNGEVLVIMQSCLKPLEENASDSAKQLHGALAMPLVLQAPMDELVNNFSTLLSEYCQQHEQTQSSLESTLGRIKENNKSARQTATTLDSKKSTSETPKKATTPTTEQNKEKDTSEPIAPPKSESITAQVNPVSLF